MESTRQVEVLENGWRKVTLPDGRTLTLPPTPQTIVVEPPEETPAVDPESPG